MEDILNNNQFRYKARQIKLLALDVDGVLTDGSVIYGNDNTELKTFNTLDGLGIRLIQQSGIAVAIITGRQSAIVIRRATELNIEHVLQKRNDKLIALQQLCQQLAIDLQQVAYMGDDLPDLPAMNNAAISIAPSNAHVDVLRYATFCTKASGGKGAVREACDTLLKASNRYDTVIKQYLLTEQGEL